MICTCRDPMELGVVHRADAPCYYPNPPKEWQGLTDEEIKEIIGPWGGEPIKGYTRELIDKIEKALRRKNG